MPTLELHSHSQVTKLTFFRNMKGGVIIDYKNSRIMFHDVPQRAWKLPKGSKGLQLIPLLG